MHDPKILITSTDTSPSAHTEIRESYVGSDLPLTPPLPPQGTMNTPTPKKDDDKKQ